MPLKKKILKNDNLTDFIDHKGNYKPENNRNKICIREYIKGFIFFGRLNARTSK